MLLIRVTRWLVGFVALATVSDWSAWRSRTEPISASAVSLEIDTSAVQAEVDERFLSVAVDIANVVGGAFWDPDRNAGAMATAQVPPYDFSRPALRSLAEALAPAYLRVGGTDADRTVYEAAGAPADVGAGRWRLSRKTWQNVSRFAQDVGFRLIFTLNAGEAARDASGRWDPASARGLIEEAVAAGDPVDVWEFGNELNVFPLLHHRWLSPRAYADDLQLVRWLLRDTAPKAQLAGPAVAFWPLLGEGLPFYGRFMRAGGDLLDIVTWHYYPSQSYRCPVATQRAKAGEVLRPRQLAEIDRWAAFVEDTRDQHGPQAAVWLGETGGAQCGGEPGASDRFASSLWWVDQLGRIARRGQPIVVRQTLSGGDYGLIDDETLAPNPDYWASLLWRRLMGTRVLPTQLRTGLGPVSAYAHCTRGEAAPGSVTLALVNVHPTRPIDVDLPDLGPEARLYLVRASSPEAHRVTLNGKPLALTAEGAVPPTEGVHVHHPQLLSLPPHAFAFVTFPQAAASACR